MLRSKEATYNILVTTSDIPRAGLLANVFLTMYGKDSSLNNGRLPLKFSLTNERPFQQGKTDNFQFKLPYIGQIEKIKIEHDDRVFGWHLSEVEIQIENTREKWNFICHDWIDRRVQNHRFLYPVELNPNKSPRQYINKEELRVYSVEFYNSKRSLVPLSTLLYLKIYGEFCSTDRVPLRKSLNNNYIFQPGQIDKFEIESRYLGKIRKIKIISDKCDEKGELVLDNIVIRASEPKEKIIFRCNETLLVGRTPNEIEFHTEYEEIKLPEQLDKSFNFNNPKIIDFIVETQTSDEMFSGTDSNVFIQIFSEKYNTDKIYLQKSLTNKNPFEKGKKDVFEIKAPYIGDIKKIKVGLDAKKLLSGWHLSYIKLEAPEYKRSWKFFCNKWFDKNKDDGQIERFLVPDNDEPMINYKVSIKTSEQVKSAGMDSNVYFRIIGSKKDSGLISLKKTKTKTYKFERGGTEIVEFALPDLGDLQKLIIGHDNSGKDRSWYLEKVVVKANELKRKWLFECNQWLAEDEGDKKIERELEATEQLEYKIEVFTGDKKNASSDSNVFIKMYGVEKRTDWIELENSETNKNKFERNKMDRFNFVLPNLGKLRKIKIKHDTTGDNSSWFLDKVEITERDSKYIFECNDWLSIETKTERVLLEKNEQKHEEKVVEENKPIFKRYYVKVYTEKKHGSSPYIDSNIYLKIFGDNYVSKDLKLSDTKSHKIKFQPNQIDVFEFRLKDLGAIFAVSVRNEAQGCENDWFLKAIEIKENRFSYFFECNEWLSPNRHDGYVERVLLEKNADIKVEDIEAELLINKDK